MTLSSWCSTLFLLSSFMCASHFQFHLIHTLTHPNYEMKQQVFVYIHEWLLPFSFFLFFFLFFCFIFIIEINKKWETKVKLPAVMARIQFIIEISYQLQFQSIKRIVVFVIIYHHLIWHVSAILPIWQRIQMVQQ